MAAVSSTIRWLIRFYLSFKKFLKLTANDARLSLGNEVNHAFGFLAGDQHANHVGVGHLRPSLARDCQRHMVATHRGRVKGSRVFHTWLFSQPHR